MGRPDIYTTHGHLLPEVVSALQKAVRRGDPVEAMYWAGEMVRSGYDNYCWRRLKVMISEDVGLGMAPGTIADFRALEETYREFKAEKRGEVFMPLAHAILLLVYSKKSHAQLHAFHYMIGDSDFFERREIPDHALDWHTRRGRNMKRGGPHFVNESSRLENEDTSYDIDWLKESWETQMTTFDTITPGSMHREVKNPVKFGKLGKPADDDRVQKRMFDDGTEVDEDGVIFGGDPDRFTQ